MTQRTMIELAARRVRECRGSYHSGSADDVFPEVALKAFLPFTRYVVVGGVATRLYMPARNTLDTDILVHPDDGERADRELEKAGAVRIGPLTCGGATWRLPNGRHLDVLKIQEDWVRQAVEHAVSGPSGEPYVSLEYLVLMKLTSSRLQDLADIGRMLGGADDGTLTRVRSVVRQHRPSDLKDLEQMIDLGRLEKG